MARLPLMTLVMMFVTFPVWSQDSQRGREGGIPRSQVESSNRRGDASQQGTDEGMPEMQPRRGGNDGRAEPYLVPDPNQPSSNRWILGVNAYNTETGVVITRVVPGSAASRTGLEPGDRIVAVNGFQVGFVGNLLYPLGDELQRHADRSGQVTLLIQNVRNRSLLNRDVRLMRRGRDRFPFPRPR